ncbi:hypothetical protein [Natranaerobius thermophilus]|uniref:RepB-like DNA primase domain-containing protein n=1 Tax=Natranaerobius thermophilus (strain ATCC BAA-1301 / DSM 18059 / JW/NM-WN-LF) TaxID=457570 RepID=B2A8N7_NATTJ|nr:hypothetical protein [Natranaerobius thermophilus]ACB86486.1 hypothetical protein Nther_2941 [Natranaerobius thermophilus JW/NM-WN-LF]
MQQGEEKIKQLKEFLAKFHGQDGEVYFQMVGDDHNPQIPKKDFNTGKLKEPKVTVDQLENVWDRLCNYHKQGYKVYFKLNSGGYLDKDIYNITAHCVDIDFHHEDDPEELEKKKNEKIEMLKNLPLPPSIIVVSPRGVHAYWLMQKQEDKTPKQIVQEINQFKYVQDALAAYFNSCTGVNLLCQGMRLPSFKGKIIETSDRRYTQEELLRHYYAEPKPKKKKEKESNQKITNDIPSATPNTIDKPKTSQVAEEVYYNYHDFFEVAKQKDLREYIGLNVPLNENFSCIYHDDQKPSARMGISEKGHYRYRCFADGCGANNPYGLTIIDLMQLNGITDFSQIIRTISETFNMKLISNEWCQKEKEKYIANMNFIKEEMTRENMYHTYQLFRHAIPIINEMLTMGITKVTPSLCSKDGLSMFFISNRYIAKRTKKWLERVNQYVNLLIWLGVFRLEQPSSNSKIYQDSVKRAEESGKEKAKEIGYKKEFSYNVISYYSMPNLYEIKQELEEKAEQLRKKYRYSISAMSEAYVANHQYPTEEIYAAEFTPNFKKSAMIRDKLLKKAKEQLGHKGYTCWQNFIRLKVKGKRVPREQVKIEFKRIEPILINELGCVKRKANKTLKQMYQLDGYPWIIVTPEVNQRVG